MRLVFTGTPAVAVPSLESLQRTGHELSAVISRPDAPLGRKRVLTASPVAAWAERHAVPTIKTARLDDAVTAEIAALKPDLGVIVAYGGLVREPLLSTPRLGWINLHFSLLPRWRGAAPVQRAVMAGDPVTGTAVFQLVAGLDAGAVFSLREHAIGPDDTAGELLDRLALTGADDVAAVVDALAAGTAQATPQSGEMTTAAKLTLDDARIRWDEPVAQVYNRIRAVTPEPGAFTVIDGARFKLLTARPHHAGPDLPPGHIGRIDGRVLIGTAGRPLELLQVQPAGRRPMPAADWWRGNGSVAAVAE